MKEIKFRQPLKKGGFHYWGYIDGAFISPMTEFDASGESEQYTGINCNNGKEIYKGDTLEGGGSHPLEVVFGKYGWCIRFTDFGHTYTEPIDDDLFEHYNPDVIGNIHENPELLKEAK